ncbi:MAG TPA: phosphate ABC transporter permease PstA [Rickettsiales bacterium]|nr:phosphate ABC transporter permease PstA [Rickettsiales bacterium]
MQNLIEKSLKKRYRKELRFKAYGIASIGFSLLFLCIFFSTIFFKGYRAFEMNKIALEIDFSPAIIIEVSQLSDDFAKLSQEKLLQEISYRGLIRKALQEKFSDIAAFKILGELSDFSLQKILVKNPQFIGTKQVVWLEAASKVDVYLKYDIKNNLSENEIKNIEFLQKNKQIKSFFNWQFFKNADSREPEAAGIAASLIGSFLTILIFLVFAFPIGVLCAFYLEEFAKKGVITDLIEISINNLAAIPSIIYGLLGLTIYLQIFHLPRSSALVGGMTLFMLVLPVIIIATRNTIRSIPSSIRDAAFGLGASKVQMVMHHLLPLSIPGIMTGVILAISRAIGETAPLLMIGMVAFIADIPKNFTEPTTALPVQIYLWSDSPEIGFAEKTAAAILVLLVFLVVFNLAAIILRKKFERKW